MLPSGLPGAGASDRTAGRSFGRRPARVPPLPDPDTDVELRPHTVGALVLELMAAAVGVVVLVDAIGRGSVAIALGATLWILAFAGGGIVARRRSTKLDAAGVTICNGISTRHLPWSQVEGFELLPHRRGRRDHIVVVTTDGPVAMPHGDSRSLSLRLELSTRWYLALVARLEAVRDRYT